VETTHQVIHSVLENLQATGLKYAHLERGDPGFHVSLLDNRKQPLRGSIAMQDDPQWDEVTLVSLDRTQVRCKNVDPDVPSLTDFLSFHDHQGDPLSWKRFWWSLTKHANLRDLIIKAERN
jgi:hypothetical protein